MTNHLVATLAFGIAATLLFAVSSTYHFLHDGFRISKSLESKFECLDHIAIYLFIAATYTPIMLNTLANPWATVIVIFAWCIAALGIFYTAFKERLPLWTQHRFIYTGLFLCMGWMFVIRSPEIVHNLSGLPLFYFIFATVCYSLGAIVYATKWPRLYENVFGFHELWHVLVLCGFGCHYFLILGFY
jgi:hemolysin III